MRLLKHSLQKLLGEKIEISQFGNLLMYKKGYTPDFVKETIERRNLNGLRIFDDLDPLDSLDFLREFNFLEALELTCIKDHDYSFLLDFPHLESLSFGQSVSMQNEIDLSRQTKLRRLAIHWRKGKIKGIENCHRLKYLCLIDYKEPDLTPVSSVRSLVELVIKTASVKSLHGLEKVDYLQKIKLGNCRYLRSLEAINGKKELKFIEIEACSRIEDFDSLNDLPNLETLNLINCNGLKSIGFLRRFPLLKEVALVGNTSVLDGDLSPLDKVPDKLVAPRRHYK